MIVYFKKEYLEDIHKISKDKRHREEIEYIIEKGLYYIEGYNAFIFNHPHDLSLLEKVDQNRIIGRVTRINWEKGCIDISLKRTSAGLRKKELKAIPVIFTHYYSGAINDPRLRLNKIFIEVLED